MNSTGSKVWKTFSNALCAAGIVGFMALFLWHLGLIGYYSFKRPYGSVPESGWTIPLRWTHGAYGTFDENERLLRLHFWGAPFVLTAALGFAIRKAQEKNELRRSKDL